MEKRELARVRARLTDALVSALDRADFADLEELVVELHESDSRVDAERLEGRRGCQDSGLSLRVGDVVFHLNVSRAR